MGNFSKIKKHIESFGYNVTAFDFERPWGGFLVIDEKQAKKFSEQFFDNISSDDLKISGKLSPKILIDMCSEELNNFFMVDRLNLNYKYFKIPSVSNIIKNQSLKRNAWSQLKLLKVKLNEF